MISFYSALQSLTNIKHNLIAEKWTVCCMPISIEIAKGNLRPPGMAHRPRKKKDSQCKEESTTCPDMSKRGACKECGDRRKGEKNTISLPFRLSETESLSLQWPLWLPQSIAWRPYPRTVVSVIAQHNVHRMYT